LTLKQFGVVIYHRPQQY